MSKTSAILGMILAVVCVLGGWVVRDGSVSLAWHEAAGAGAGLAAFAVLTWKGRRWAQVLLSLAGMALLGRFLPVYFQTAQMWPFLAVIILGSGTFGIGILGVLLDAFAADEAARQARREARRPGR